MKEKAYLSSGEVAKALGVSVQTVQRWDQAGVRTVVRTIHHQRRIPASEITRLTRGIGQPRGVISARVSASGQEHAGHLERQTDRLRQVANTRGYLLVETLAEHASSLKEKRRGMKKLFALSAKEAGDGVLIESAERRVRFGFPSLLQAFAWPGVRLEVLEAPEKQEPLAEMTAELARHRSRVLWAHGWASSKTCASVYDESDSSVLAGGRANRLTLKSSLHGCNWCTKRLEKSQRRSSPQTNC